MINNFLQFTTKLILVMLILTSLFGCASGNKQGTQNANPPYSQYPQYAPASVRQDGYYYNAPQQQPAYSNSPYQYQQPASRYYSNPYAMPPQNQYPYYDGDQYYVPPTYYGGANRDNPTSSANQKY